MRKIFSILLILSPLLFFPQRKVEDFFNNRIDFVLDNNHGRAFMGAIVKEYIIDDSLSVNNSYNKIGVQPFYKYSQSGFFDKNLLVENKSVFANREKTEFTFRNSVASKANFDYSLSVNSLGSFNIKSEVTDYGRYRIDVKVRKSYYETFKNFELSFFAKKWNGHEILAKNLYSNVNIVVYGISLFEKQNIPADIIFYNTLTIKFSNADQEIAFLISVYETIGITGDYHYFGPEPTIVMRKVAITGNKEEAVKYLTKNKVDFTEIDPQNYLEENFRKRDN